MKTFTRDEVKKHSSEEDLWIVIDSKVYDVTDFLDAHPGGMAALLHPLIAGKDATQQFFNLHRGEVLEKYQKLVIGQIEGEKETIKIRKTGEISTTPYSEPTWLSKGYFNTYYNASHKTLQEHMRKFCEEHVKPDAEEKEESGEYPDRDLLKLMGKDGINLHAMRLGPGKHLHGLNLLGGIKGEEFDYFHEMIIHQELARVTPRGYADALAAGLVIGLPPVKNFSSKHADPDAFRNKILKETLSGEKIICLAISEAYAGSDVAGLTTFAKKSEDGKHYIVNGSKKWITNGCFADYFTTAVRTDKGLSVLLIPRMEGVETKQIKTSYSTCAGTAFITFDNVKVPAENLLGKENQGLKIVLSNFNHERWVMCAGSARSQKIIVEECLKWANQRLVFGKNLLAQPVIRQKLAKMISLTEASQNWLENVTYQMCKMSYNEQSRYLGGMIGMLKMFSTRCEHEIADEAVQIFGGRGITKTGMGKKIEAFHRTYKFNAILGGAEEVLGDLGVRQAMKDLGTSKL